MKIYDMYLNTYIVNGRMYYLPYLLWSQYFYLKLLTFIVFLYTMLPMTKDPHVQYTTNVMSISAIRHVWLRVSVVDCYCWWLALMRYDGSSPVVWPVWVKVPVLNLSTLMRKLWYSFDEFHVAIFGVKITFNIITLFVTRFASLRWGTPIQCGWIGIPYRTKRKLRSSRAPKLLIATNIWSLISDEETSCTEPPGHFFRPFFCSVL